MDSRDEALLAAAHFKPCPDGVWMYRKENFNQDTGQSRNAVVALKVRADGRFEGYVPMVDDPVSKNDVDGVPARGLRFSTVDVRDIVAMALGEKASAMMEIYGAVTETGFEQPGSLTWITMPFHGDPYGDYAIAHASASGAYHELKDPADVFGPAYREWRDEHCSDIVPAAPKP